MRVGIPGWQSSVGFRQCLANDLYGETLLVMMCSMEFIE